MYVYKFGGTSISTAKRMKHVVNIVSDKNRKVIVCSAIDGVTEKLIHLAELASEGKQREVEFLLSNIEELHKNILFDAVSGGSAREDAQKNIDEKVELLRVLCSACSTVREVTPKEKDLILSCGEMISTPILNALLLESGFDTVCMSGGEAGIVTDDNFGDAIPIFEMTYHNIRKRILPLLENGKMPVISGYTALTQHGDVSTLGRGGSDYTATLIGAAIRAKEIVIWSDVDGLMTADPKVVKDAKAIDEVSYAEAREMAFFGAKSLHPRCLDPAEEYGIAVRFRNTFKPNKPGTVVKKNTRKKGNVTAVTLVRDVAAITVRGTSMVGKPGSAARVFNNVAKTGTNVMMISQSISESNISFVVKRPDARKAARALEREMVSTGKLADVYVEEGVSVVAVIGEKMRGTPGIASKIFGALGEENINVKMIAQGSSEMNISIVVDEKDCYDAVRVIHRKFQLDKG